MAITEQAIQLLARVTTEVEARFVDFTDLAHGFEHVYRVYHLALSLSEQEQADGLIVGMAALRQPGSMRGDALGHDREAWALASDEDLPC